MVGAILWYPHKTYTLIIYSFVRVKELFKQGKSYPWRKPKRCPVCGGRRLWWHGFVLRSFHGFVSKVWVRRCICAACKRVHTLRPHTHWARLQYSRFIILVCLVSRIRDGHWYRGILRQNQQYWYRGLMIQRGIYESGGAITLDVVKTLLMAGALPASHSTDRATNHTINREILCL